jgi:3-hydroxypropanoate dehydrogenase
MMDTSKTINNQALDTLFRSARTYNHWLDRPVEAEQLRAIHDLLKMGPTSANCSPARFVFLQSPEAKQRLKPHLDAGNVDKTMAAPVTAIIAYDYDFYEHMPKLFPHTDAKSWFAGRPDFIKETADRNGALQAAYLFMAARALGLDCGPMTGFNPEGVKAEFFPDKNWKADILCNIGYGDDEGMFPRSPRFDFDEACEIL